MGNPVKCPHKSSSSRQVAFGVICDDCGLVRANQDFRIKLQRAVASNTQPPCPVCGKGLSSGLGKNKIFTCRSCGQRVEYNENIEKIASVIQDQDFRRSVFYALTERHRLLGKCPACEKDRLARIGELAVKCLDCGLTIRRCPDESDVEFEFFFLKIDR